MCEISPVAALCCSTAAATAEVYSLISRMRPAMLPIASTAPAVEPCTAWICAAISSVALAVCTASDFTSEATTAKPRPDSPARAASIVALSASRLVCPAMSRISLTTSPIFCAASASPVIRVLVASASPTAARTTSRVRVSCALISPIEVDSSPAAAAAVSTLVEASFDASTAADVRCEVWSDEPNSPLAVSRMALTPSVTTRQHALDALAERGERGLDGGAAGFLFLHRDALPVGGARSVMSSCVATQPPPSSGC